LTAATGKLNISASGGKKDPDLPSRTGIIDTAEARRLFLNDMQVELFYLPLRNEFMYEAMPKISGWHTASTLHDDQHD
jgi:hypothetical protein